MAKVNLNQFNKQMMAVKQAMDSLPADAYDYFVQQTPRRTGNARKNTKLQDTKIVADYAYSERLDKGYSKQSPNGMVEPTEKWIQREVDRRLKGL